MANQYPYDLFFGGQDHPRHGCKLIGHTGVNHRDVFFSFDTQALPTESDATTKVSNGERDIATLTWILRNFPGSYQVEGMNRPAMMTHLCTGSPNSSGRLFQISGRRTFGWRKNLETTEQGSFDLYSIATGQVVAGFRRFSEVQQTPAGPMYATLAHGFDDDELLLYAVLALCVNRWLDTQGLL